MIRSIEHQRGPRIVYKGKQFRRTSILMLFLPILGQKWIKKCRIWFLWNHRTLKFYSMMILVKYGNHYLKMAKKEQIPNFKSALKFSTRYSSQSQNVNFLRKSHKDKAWNDWKPKRNEKSIHRQIQAALLNFAPFFAFFKPKTDQKRAASDFFGILGT